VGGLTPEATADVLSRAVGHWGSGAEYPMQTIDQFDRLGIRDKNLRHLERLVAQRLIGLQDPLGQLTYAHVVASRRVLLKSNDVGRCGID
jgi:hypothetical protein